MIRDDAVTTAFHRLTVYNRQGGDIQIDNYIKNIIKNGLQGLKVTGQDEKKQCFEHYHLYVNEIEENGNNIYCRVSDSRFGYPEDIYIAASDETIETGVEDVRSKKFFMNLDFSNKGYILICNQYLGNSGCYMAIEKALRKILTNSGYKLNSIAIVNKGELNEYFQKGGIRAFEVTRFESQPDVADDNGFLKKCTVCLSPTTRSKTSLNKFYNKVRSFFIGDNDNIRDKQEIAKMVIQESDIKAAIVANDGIDGIDLGQYRVRVISKHGQYDLINQDGTMATKYLVANCVKDPDGNPNFEDIKNKTNEIMEKIKRTID